jgi:hypothetical protein
LAPIFDSKVHQSWLKTLATVALHNILLLQLLPAAPLLVVVTNSTVSSVWSEMFDSLSFSGAGHLRISHLRTNLFNFTHT